MGMIFSVRRYDSGFEVHTKKHDICLDIKLKLKKHSQDIALVAP